MLNLMRADGIGMNVSVSAMQRERVLMVRSGRGLLVGHTKPLLCNQLAVKSQLCGPHKG